MFSRIFAVLAFSGLVAAVTGIAAQADEPTGPANSTNSKLIGSYGVELVLGPAEKSSAMKGAMKGMPMDGMPMPASASTAAAPEEGMVHVGGAQMIEPPDTANAPKLSDYRHLVVFVYSKDVDVQDAKVRIMYTIEGGKPVDLPVATMYDAKGGPETTHYGNNVKLKPGNYTVAVTVNGTSGDFKISVK